MAWKFIAQTDSLGEIGRTPLERLSKNLIFFTFDVDTGTFMCQRGSGFNNTIKVNINLYEDSELSWKYYVGSENIDEMKSFRDYGLANLGKGINIRSSILDLNHKEFDTAGFIAQSNSQPFGDEVYTLKIFKEILKYYDGKGFSYDNRDQTLYGDNASSTHTGFTYYPDVMIGANGNDTLITLLGDDKAYGRKGNDQIYGGYGNDQLFGEDGADSLYGEQNNDVLRGGAGNDVLDGGLGADTMIGGSGDDVYYVDNRRDVILDQGKASDVDTVLIPVFLKYTLPTNVEDATLQGTDDSDLNGNKLGNELEGNDGDNELDGAAGNDELTGGDGDDVLEGGQGKDVLEGGNGDDQFLFADKLSAGNVDRIEDFIRVDDTVLLEKDIFTALGKGQLQASAFTLGKHAQDASDRIIFDPNSGKLFYDRDGTGSADAVLVATIETPDTLKASDFLIV